MSNLEAALAYLNSGYRIFPCTPRAKRPAGALAPHGFKDASSDRETITRWWTAQPDANIGLPTDEANGVFVLDVDPPHGHESWARLCAGHEQPQTYTVQTPSGGLHLYFKWPQGGQRRRIKVWPGLDFMGEGGYVVAPPSVLESGAYQIKDHSELAEVPDWLLAALAPLELSPTSPAPPSTTALRVPVPQSIPVGQRDDSLYRIACSYRGEGLGQNQILDRLRIDNRRCTEPLDEMSLARIARSACRHPAGLVITTSSSNVAPADPDVLTSEPLMQRLDLADLLKNGIPPIDWLVENWLAVGDVAMFAGGAFAGKSTTAAALARALATGTEWLGIPCRQRPVFYFDEEQGVAATVRMFGRLGGAAAALQVASGQGLRLTDSARMALLDEWLAEFPPGAVVFLDSVQQIFGATNANDATEIGNLYRELLKRRDRQDVTFVLIHHMRKRPTQGFAGFDLDYVRDSSAHTTQCSAVFLMEKDGEHALLSQAKRRGTDLISMRILYSSDGPNDPITLTGEGPPEIAESTAEIATMKALEYLREHGRAKTSELVEVMTGYRFTKRASERAIKQLRQTGAIHCVRKGIYEIRSATSATEGEIF